jgi:hypothetical protein
VPHRSRRLPVAIFVASCAILLTATTLYVARRAQATAQPPVEADLPTSAPSLAAALTTPHVLFVDAPDFMHRHLAVAPLEAPESARYVTDATCDRVYFSGGRGLCLGSEEHYYGNRGARDFDAALQPGRSYEDVRGISSRARVSPDGRYGSLTVFVSGDSYGAPFSTRTHILDLPDGRELGTLEDFTVYKDGAVFQAPDFNFWGTTFARDGHRFYATLGNGTVSGTTYLVEGDVSRREMRVLRTGVECPSLSPDGTRIAFKKRTGSGASWRVAVLDLATLQDTPLNEPGNVDDQVEWLDNAHVLYSLARRLPERGSFTTDVWVATVDGSELPQLFLHNALSPSVVR